MAKVDSKNQKGTSESSRPFDQGLIGVLAVVIGLLMILLAPYPTIALNQVVPLGFAIMVFGLGIELYDILRTLHQIRDK